MRAVISDKSSLLAVKPKNIVSYLKNRGWNFEKECHGSSIWIKVVGNDVFEIQVPDVGVADFSLRISELFSTLEVEEDRSQLEIIEDLTSTSSDIVRFRLLAEDYNDGSIPLSEGAEINRKVWEAISAAASSASNPKMYYSGRRSDDVNSYLNTLRLGHSERGSYILKLLSPVPPLLEFGKQTPLFEQTVPKPFSRQVTETLMGSLGAIQKATRKSIVSGTMDSFEESVASGVSANLCDAIVGLCGGSEEAGRPLEISVSWAGNRPSPIHLPLKVSFHPEVIPYLSEASRVFKEKAIRDNFELRGIVVRLERSEGEDVGKVTVEGLVDDRFRKVSLELRGDAYTTAVHSHEQMVPVECTGELVKEGRGLFLREPREFKIERRQSDE